MNILDTTDKSLAPTCNGYNNTPSVSKVQKFHWSDGGTTGEFRMISKHLLQIDGVYQRECVSVPKVLRIAREWSWINLGVIVVVMRNDGSYWVVDGGHRVRASFYRDDIDLLPCMSWTFESIQNEARAFYATNTTASLVSAFDKFRAASVAEDPVAIELQNILTEFRVVPQKHSANSRDTIKCVGTLWRACADDPGLVRQCLALLLQLPGDEAITGDLFGGLLALCKRCRRHGILFFSSEYSNRLLIHSQREIEIRMRQKKAETGRCGSEASSLAMIELINKGRRTNKLTLTENI
jgi:hypothetical protein